MDHREVVWEKEKCAYLAQTKDKWWAVVNTATNLRVLQNARDFLITCRTFILSSRALQHGNN